MIAERLAGSVGETLACIVGSARLLPKPASRRKGMQDRMVRSRILFAVVIAMALVAGFHSGVRAEDEDTGWKDTAELGMVFTSGNAESSSFGFKNKLFREWDRSALVFKAGGIRVSTTTITRIPVAPDPLDPFTYDVRETKTDETTAENYYLNGRYDRKITDRFVWYAGAGWDRNRFAGIDNRYVIEGGVGNIWFDDDDMKFKTSYALTFTKQEDVFELPGVDDTFLGARFSWDYMNKLGKNAEYANTLQLDENLDETSDWRADMTNSLSVAMNKSMALKVSLQLLYDNEPSFELIEVQDLTGVGLGELVPVEFDELDTIFTASLVINF
jgi:putative salt-induced outer membrane protein YdiY